MVRALEHEGADVLVTAEAAEVRTASRLVVPGQGAFLDCMQRLKRAGLDDAIRQHIGAGRPYLGICLGLQVLFDEGHEHGNHAGLGVLRGTCEPLPSRVKDADGAPVRLKLPHMGWNRASGAPEVLGPLDDEWFYFVHSYHVVPTEALEVATAEYGRPFVAAVRRDNILACQFHPEKSHSAGLQLLGAFLS